MSTLRTLSLAGLLAMSATVGAIAQDVVNLRYAIWDQSQVPTFEKLIAAFEEANPNVNVDMQVTPFTNYWTKLQTQAGNGDLPDVFWMNPFNFPLYASQGVIAPIDDLAAASGFDVEAIPQQMRDIYSYDGNLYALPNNRDAIVVWYNKKLFADAGVAEPAADWTWADFQDAAQKLTNNEAGIWGTAAQMNFRATFLNTIYQAGGTVLSEDKATAQWDADAARQGVQFWVDIANAGATPTLEQLASTDESSLFMSGKVAMIWTGSWMGITYKGSELAANGQLGVVGLPKGPDNSAASTSSLGNVLSPLTEHADEAYAFIEFLGSKEAADIYTQGGIALSAYPEFDQNFVDYFAGAFDAQPISDQIAKTFNMPVSLNSSVWQKAINERMAPVWLGQTPVEEGLAALQADMQAALEEEANL